MTEPAKPRLTLAQWRVLDEVLAIPGRTYNGRSRKAVDALEAASLVTTFREIDQTTAKHPLRIKVFPVDAAIRAYLAHLGLLAS